MRVSNRPGGWIEVSLDRGRSYRVVGRVARPATENTDGAAYASAVSPGAVTLAGATRLLVRTHPDGARPRVFGIQAAGVTPAPWAVATDIPAGEAIFAALAPPVGTSLFLEGKSGLRRLPPGYVPTREDVLVFVAELKRRPPAAIVWENRTGGRVLVLDGSGGEEPIGTVRRAAKAVGRYPGTGVVTPGGLVEHHPGALLVSTGAGGFRIDTGTSADATPDTFLQYEPSDPSARAYLAAPFPLDVKTRVEMRVDEGPWIPLPRLSPHVPGALGAGLAHCAVPGLDPPRVGVTHFRLRFGGDPEARRTALAQATARAIARSSPVAVRERPTVIADRRSKVAVGKENHAGRPFPWPSAIDDRRSGIGSAATPSQAPPVRGKVNVKANVTGEGITYVVFVLDGRVAKVTNVPPYSWSWDTRSVPNGVHTVTIQGKDEDGNLINQRTTRVHVRN